MPEEDCDSFNIYSALTLVPRLAHLAGLDLGLPVQAPG